MNRPLFRQVLEHIIAHNRGEAYLYHAVCDLIFQIPELLNDFGLTREEFRWLSSDDRTIADFEKFYETGTIPE